MGQYYNCDYCGKERVQLVELYRISIIKHAPEDHKSDNAMRSIDLCAGCMVKIRGALETRGI